jgi:hypothetical protein
MLFLQQYCLWAAAPFVALGVWLTLRKRQHLRTRWPVIKCLRWISALFTLFVISVIFLFYLREISGYSGYYAFDNLIFLLMIYLLSITVAISIKALPDWW